MQTGTIKIKTKLQTRWMCLMLTFGCFFLALLWFSHARAATDTAPVSSWFVDMNQYKNGAHGSLSCEECHGTMISNGLENGISNGIGKGQDTGMGKKIIHPDPAAIDFLKIQAKRNFDYKTCWKCHKTAYKRYLKGEHAKAMLKEKTNGKPSETGFAPTCGDCHSAHYSKSHLSRIQTGKIMTQSCGTCHTEQKKSFLTNYHGKAAVNLEYDKAAFCTDCHGAHTMLSLKDKEAALNACLRCHSDASSEFANIIIHDTAKNLDLKSDAKKSGLKWVHWLGTLSLIFVVVVLLFFYLHTGLLMLRKLHEKLRRHK
ncbi:multiheme c-type cytochrome [Desulfobacula sp.]